MSTMTLHHAQMTRSKTRHGRFNRLVAAVVKPVTQWLRQRRTERTLSGLSDRQLRDIGIDRSEITAVSGRLAREPHKRHIRDLRR